MLKVAKSSRLARCQASWRWSHLSARCQSTTSLRQHDPLSVLFCGADEFSIASLLALHELHKRNVAKVASIDVVCRPDKRTGRGLKQIQEVPIKSVANNLGLRIHQIDTVTGWTPPTPYNLVVAVSFGLLVPSRILTSAKYGGLNVHPSMLPDLRGPAPIIHTLLKQRAYTGVTLQTMHPTRFDHGAVIAQTPAPGIPVVPDCTPEALSEIVSTLGAEMLSKTIESGLFIPLLQPTLNRSPDGCLLDHAPKITPEDRHIDWPTWSAERIVRYDRVLGRLWDTQTHYRCSRDPQRGQTKRITFEGPWTTTKAGVLDDGIGQLTAGQPVLVTGSNDKEQRLGIFTCDNSVVVPAAATIEGEAKGRGLHRLVQALGTIESRA